MTLYPFFRLLRRPAAVVWFAGGTAFAFVMAAFSVDFLPPLNEWTPRKTLLMWGRGLLLASTINGYLVGSVLAEVQHSLNAFTLPRLRWSLRFGALALGMGLAVLAVAIYWLIGGLFSWTLFLLIGFGFLLGMTLVDPLGRLSLTLFNLALVFVLILRMETMTQFMETYPLTTLPMLGLAAFWANRALGLPTFRNKPFVPTLSKISLFSLPVEKRYRREQLQRKVRLRNRLWTPPLSGGSLYNWVRAAVYEASGRLRTGWFGYHLLWSATIVPMVVAFVIFDAVENGFDWRLGLEWSYRALYYTAASDPQHTKELGYWTLTWFLPWVWILLLWTTAPLLKFNRVYPLSRRHIGRIVYWSGTFQLALLVMLTTGFCSLGFILLGVSTGQPWPEPLVPGFLRAALIGAALMPAVQWGRMALLRGCGWHWSNAAVFMAGMMMNCILLMLAVPRWARLFTDLGPAVELGALALLVAASQRLYRRVVMRRFASIDLT